MKRELAIVIPGSQKAEEQSEEEYELPDGTKIKLKEERAQCTDLLFESEMEGQTFSELVYDCIMQCTLFFSCFPNPSQPLNGPKKRHKAPKTALKPPQKTPGKERKKLHGKTNVPKMSAMNYSQI